MSEERATFASRAILTLDVTSVAVVSALICFASHRLLLMTVLVPAVLALRVIVAARLCRAEGRSVRAELVFYAVCTALGAFNDWNSVVAKRIYDYHVPHYFAFSSIPLWMLLYWGLILRFMAELGWHIAGEHLPNTVGVGRLSIKSARVRVGVILALILATRQAIYVYYLDPVLSWLPFLIALVLLLLLSRPTKGDAALLAVFLVGGPLVEVLYIHVGGLHSYHLGVAGGVPVWLILWWLMSVLTWREVSLRLYGWLNQRLGAA